MEDWAEKHRNTSFSNNVSQTLREMSGHHRILAGSSDSYSGNEKSRITNRFGRLKMKRKTERNPDTDNTNATSLLRWIKAKERGTVAPLIDVDDQDVTEVDLSSPLVTETAEAALAYHDDQFWDGYFGDAYEGSGGDTVVSFKAANIIPHGGTGLTMAKLKAIRELMRKRNAWNSREDAVMLLHPEDETALLSIQEYIDYDYSGVRKLDDGEIKPFFGFRFFPLNVAEENLPDSYQNFFTDADATRQLPVFRPSGMHHGMWDAFTGYIDRRPDKDQATQIWGGSRSAAVRLDEDLCFMCETQ